ncbi:MAG: class I SAM-dependent methyltransferase [Candidatus Omnitrophica bacterium]|nr:class I SAM-dependent methyltransferase [Candidatus Omnitrophota bacterium]
MAYTVQTTQQLREAYDAVYAKRPVHRQDPHYRWLADLLGLKAGGSLLDVACGTGWMLTEALRRGLQASGLDLSSKAVELSKAHAPQAEVRVGDGENLPWAEGRFDYVTCLGSLEHYLNPDRGIREIARVLKPGGTACVMLPNKYYLPHVWQEIRTGQAPQEQEGFERLQTRREWRRLLEENGLIIRKVVRQNEIKPLLTPGTWKVKSLRKTLTSWLMRAFCPMDLSYHFVFLCGRPPGKA